MKPRIALIAGDPAGIGPERIAKLLVIEIGNPPATVTPRWKPMSFIAICP
ncbi:MAG TPA: hypothetical protein VJT32_00415 [bacterium]|nr:hypothetical protein [bacterium]